MIAPALILAASLLAQAPPAGTRAEIGDEATLFVPEGYRPADGVVDVVLHLHGAPAAVERALVDAKWPAVLIEFNRKGLSGAYARPFADRALFPRLLDNAMKSMRGRFAGVKLGRIAVSSFSAGFGGVREILKVPEHAARIDVLVMADSIYAGYAGEPARHEPDPTLMAGFRDYAIKAAGGSKVMVVTHSAQVPEGYASTAETADDIVRSVGGKATPGRVDRGEGWVQSREFRERGLIVRGFEGPGPEDHMRHLRRISEAWGWALGR